MTSCVFAICICTYQRAKLLNRLLDNLQQQSTTSTYLIVVDGDPGSNEVREILATKQFGEACHVSYIPSKHANLSFQRYLGWRLATKSNVEILIYLDDDILLSSDTAIETLLFPFTLKNHNIVGVTANTVGNPQNLGDHRVLIERANQNEHHKAWIVKQLGPSKNLPPGDLSPSGNRIMPMRDSEYPQYGRVNWFQGRVMVIRMNRISQATFSEDLFALTYINCGLGEDSFLSRRLIDSGDIWYALDAGIDHPDDAPPNAYPIEAFRLGYATAYSRRFLNDTYRGFNPPTLNDRVALLKTYVGNTILNYYKVITAYQRYRLAYAWGYNLGALRGLVQKPTAKNLTPNIDWWQDAEDALGKSEYMQARSPITQTL